MTETPPPKRGRGRPQTNHKYLKVGVSWTLYRHLKAAARAEGIDISEEIRRRLRNPLPPTATPTKEHPMTTKTAITHTAWCDTADHESIESLHMYGTEGGCSGPMREVTFSAGWSISGYLMQSGAGAPPKACIEFPKSAGDQVLTMDDMRALADFMAKLTA